MITQLINHHEVEAVGYVFFMLSSTKPEVNWLEKLFYLITLEIKEHINNSSNCCLGFLSSTIPIDQMATSTDWSAQHDNHPGAT